MLIIITVAQKYSHLIKVGIYNIVWRQFFASVPFAAVCSLKYWLAAFIYQGSSGGPLIDIFMQVPLTAP